MHLNPPSGIELPESGTVDLMTTYEIHEGKLCPVAVDGKPLDMAEDESYGDKEEYGGEQENETEITINVGQPNKGGMPMADFLSAIEQAISRK